MGTRHRRLLSSFTIKPESKKRQERQEREAKQEEAAEARGNRGKKPHYINEECPPWINETIWTKLVKLQGSEKFRQKFEQMKFANSCRCTKGRTGPLGEVGITERLRIQLARSPDPEEVIHEMHRDKGYPRRNKRPSVSMSSKHTSADENVSCGDEDPLLPLVRAS